MPALLHIAHLSKSYPNQTVLHDISLDVASGEVLALVGESGAGKSTLLQLLAGLSAPDSGEIQLNEADVTSYARRLVTGHPAIKLVPQDYRLFPNITLRENIAYALREYTADYKAIRVAQLLELCNLDAVADRRPREASGGEQQRTALARALAESPKLLLLDEPFSHLDAVQKQVLRQAVVTLVKAEGVGCIMVTHDIFDALLVADRIGVMQKGRLVQLTTPAELIQNPGSPYVQALIESVRAYLAALQKLF